MTVKLKGTWKKDERVFNGLEHIADDLTKRPHDRRVVVAVVETARITTNVEDGGGVEITARLVHIEPLIAPLAVMDARKLLDQAYQDRTGGKAPPQEPLPFSDTDGEADAEDGDDAQAAAEGDDEDDDDGSAVPAAEFSAAQ